MCNQYIQQRPVKLLKGLIYSYKVVNLNPIDVRMLIGRSYINGFSKCYLSLESCLRSNKPTKSNSPIFFYWKGDIIELVGET